MQRGGRDAFMQRESEGKQREKRPDQDSGDSLTGVLKKSTAEARIAARMNEVCGGTLFLCRLNGLKGINEQYGHLAGDECLRQVACILSYMIRPDDILGRRGGDEFEIFISGCQDTQQSQNICQRIHDRFRARRGGGSGRIPLSVTVVWTRREPEDTMRELFERADKEMERKRAQLGTVPGQGKEGKGYKRDAVQVRKELMERIQQPGGYCQDYETFKGICRFLARGIIRSGQKACVILITVVNEEGGSLRPYEKDVLMEQLGEEIGAGLRMGDVYTRYSSSQFLLLVIDATESQAGTIAERVRKQFLSGRQGNDILVHSCCELQPVRIKQTAESGDVDRVPKRSKKE